MIRLRVLVIFIVCWAIGQAGCASDTRVEEHAPATSEQTTDAVSSLVETDSYEGAIFPSQEALRSLRLLDQEADDAWTPSVADVAAAEAKLTSYLRSRGRGQLAERSREYQRQYFGFVQGDVRLLMINFFCDPLETDWRNAAVSIDDGGDCYFQALYDINLGSFTALYVNGES